jgi:hypothetical protein
MSCIFYSPISKSFLEIDKMVSYAKENCPSYITCDAVARGKNYGNYRFHFGNEKDYMLFVLRWS